MTPFLRKLLGMNWILVAAMIAISVAGIMFIHGASYMHTEDRYWQKQTTWVVFGLITFLITTLVDYRWIKWASIPMYVVSIVLLLVTIKFGREINGAKCWLQIPGIGLFQPSQMAVVSGVLLLGFFLSQFPNLHPFFRLAISAAIVGPPMLIILKQPDNGMTLVWIPVIMSMLWLGGIPVRWMLLISIVGLMLLPLAICFGLKPYARQRIVTFMDPDIDPQGSSFALNQCMIAIGSGGFTGKGFKAPDTQLELGMIPSDVAHTDYIFATIGEQWGYLGGIAIVGAFTVLLASCLLTARQASDGFGMLICVGFAAQIFFHVYQNIGMTIALMPITGLPLPLISYGGTFVLMVMFALGLVNSVWVHRKEVAPSRDGYA